MGLYGLILALTPDVHDAEGRVRALDRSQGVADPGTNLSPRFDAALVASEDARFYTHHGIDSLGVLRAATSALRGSGEAGGSTLDQQLAKQLYFSGEQGGVLAKAEQVGLGVKLDATYSKPHILEMYAAVVYFGRNFYGLDAASRGYFGLAANQLSWGQAALLAGVIPAPAAYDPVIHPDLAAARERQVLGRLVDTGQLTPAQARLAANAPLNVLGQPGRGTP